MVFAVLLLLGGILFFIMGKLEKYLSKGSFLFRLLNYLVSLPWMIFGLLCVFLMTAMVSGLVFLVPFLIISIFIDLSLNEVYREFVILPVILSLFATYILMTDKYGDFYYKRWLYYKGDDEE